MKNNIKIEIKKIIMTCIKEVGGEITDEDNAESGVEMIKMLIEKEMKQAILKAEN